MLILALRIVEGGNGDAAKALARCPAGPEHFAGRGCYAHSHTAPGMSSVHAHTAQCFLMRI